MPARLAPRRSPPIRTSNSPVASSATTPASRSIRREEYTLRGPTSEACPERPRRIRTRSSGTRTEPEQVIDHTGEAVIIKDLKSVVPYWNREAASLYGFSAEEAIGKPLRSLHAPDLSEADYARVLERVRAGRPSASFADRGKRAAKSCASHSKPHRY